MFKVICDGLLYDVYDITERSYLVYLGDELLQLPKEDCEVV